jgi:dynein heavy chain, axonemal
MNIVRRWGNMYKDHLVNNVTHSLSDLANFIRQAAEGLLQTVNEGDYAALVKIMGFLMNVKERCAVTDEMFEPLTETIELLKYYDMDIPEEVNVLLQELPEQWTNIKKLAATVKQQVAPLQAVEVVAIRNRIVTFEMNIMLFREIFKTFEFFRYDSVDPYLKLDKANNDIYRLEKEMQNTYESGSLFEVSVPDFKILRQCRRELKMLKVSLSKFE